MRTTRYAVENMNPAEATKMIQIRDVPEDVHRRLKVRAAQQGTTLSEMIREVVTDLAGRPSREEIYERISKRPTREIAESPTETVRRMRDATS